MEVILLQDVKTLGKKGDVVNVNDGYARNFIIPKKLGVEATAKNLNDMRLQKANEDKRNAEILQEAKDFAAKLKELQVELKIKCGENGRIFGSISTKEIATAMKDQLGFEIDKKKLVLPEPIKNIGVTMVPIKLHPKVTGEIKVKVTEL